MRSTAPFTQGSLGVRLFLMRVVEGADPYRAWWNFKLRPALSERERDRAAARPDPYRHGGIPSRALRCHPRASILLEILRYARE